MSYDVWSGNSLRQYLGARRLYLLLLERGFFVRSCDMRPNLRVMRVNYIDLRGAVN